MAKVLVVALPPVVGFAWSVYPTLIVILGGVANKVEAALAMTGGAF